MRSLRILERRLNLFEISVLLTTQSRESLENDMGRGLGSAREDFRRCEISCFEFLRFPPLIGECHPPPEVDRSKSVL